MSPSILGQSAAGIGRSKAPESLTPANMNSGSPVSTGSIVPLSQEGQVVDLPDAGDQMQASSSYQAQGGKIQAVGPGTGEPTSDAEQTLTPQERHRQELINRGDLPEDQPLPVE